MSPITYDRLHVSGDIGESLLAAAYLLLERDGILGTLFYDKTPTLRNFLSWQDLNNSQYIAGFVSNLGHSEIAGIGWLWNISGPPGGRRADVGIAFAKKFWGDGIPAKLTEQMLEWAFTTGRIDVLYGITPSWNRLAQRLARQAGFTLEGPFPKWGICHGVPGDAVIGYLEKATWEKSRSVL